jgi:CrcB protein
MSDALPWLGVVLAGGCGAVLRFLVDEAVRARAGGAFPSGILAVNVSGALLLGLLSGLALGDDTYLVLGTALVGSYTTFSTWMLDTVAAASRGLLALAALNVGLSLALGLAAAALGRALGAVL